MFKHTFSRQESGARLPVFLFSLLLITAAFISAPLPAQAADIPPPGYSREAWRFVREQLIPMESAYFQPGIGLDVHSGMPYDHIRVRKSTGHLAEVGRYTAASKISLSIAYLLNVLIENPAYDFAAMDPHQAQEYLSRSLRALSEFNQQHPQYRGFFPWMQIRRNGDLWPANRKIPSLDNGQLTWSLAAVVGALERSPRNDWQQLAKQAQQLIDAQDYALFLDPDRRRMHGTVALDDQGRINGDASYFLADMYEGTLAVLWAVLHDYADERVWDGLPLHTVGIEFGSGETLRAMLGFRGSFHEHWALAYLPFMQSNLAPLYHNFLRAQAEHAAAQGIPGFLTTAYDSQGVYRQMGVKVVASAAVDRQDVAVSFATAMGFLIDAEATLPWMRAYVAMPRMQQSYGILESVGADGYADIYTPDAKGMTLLAAGGGLQNPIDQYLSRRRLADSEVTLAKRLLQLMNAKALSAGVSDLVATNADWPQPPQNLAVNESGPDQAANTIDLSALLQPGHLHGKHVRSLGHETLEDDIRADQAVTFEYQIPAEAAAEDQWAFRGTYLNPAQGIAKMRYFSAWIPSAVSSCAYKIEFKRDDIQLGSAWIRPEAMRSAPVNGWQRVIVPVQVNNLAWQMPMNYLAVALQDPQHAVAAQAELKREGLVLLKDMQLLSAMPGGPDT